MRGIHPAQGFSIWLKSFLLHPDLACDPTGMVTTLCSQKGSGFDSTVITFSEEAEQKAER